YFVITCERSVLYDRINRRVDIMREGGLLKEMIGLLLSGVNKNMTSMKGIGYREFLENEGFMERFNEIINKLKCDGEFKISDEGLLKCENFERNVLIDKVLKEFSKPEYEPLVEEVFEKIKLDTRHFAKRQITWFKRENGVKWINRSEEAFDSVSKIISFITESFMI
nr:hypothetical protein [Lachnospiraceae bacterium]